jgi:chromosome partitioning protein
MGRIITIAQQKGGAGKTTVTAHLAVAWQQAGHKVALVDIDPQGSLTRWFETRTAVLNGAADMVHSRISGWRIEREAQHLARTNDLVLIDSPPHAETEARIAVRVASLVVVPVQPSPMDVWATQPTIDLGKQEKVPVLLVLNRVPARSRMTDALVSEIRKLLTPPAVDLAKTWIGNRIGYAGALLAGRAVTEVDRGSTAATEMTTLAEEILGRLG